MSDVIAVVYMTCDRQTDRQTDRRTDVRLTLFRLLEEYGIAESGDQAKRTYSWQVEDN